MKGQFEDVISYLLGQHEVADKLKEISSKSNQSATASFAYKLTLENELRTKFNEYGYDTTEQKNAILVKLNTLLKRLAVHTEPDSLEYLTVAISMDLVVEGYVISHDVLKLFNLLYKKYRL